MKNIFIFIFILLSLAGRAEDISSEFNRGNQLYEQQKFSEAATVYEEIIKGGQISPALYFNLGNARFKMGQIGRAIAAYRHAEKYSPRDSDIRANLYFARTEAYGGNTPRISLLKRWLNKLSLNEWTVLTIVASAIFFLLLAWQQWQPAIAKNLGALKIIAGFFFLFCAVSLGLAAKQNLFSESAVVIVPEAVVRRGPFDESQSSFTLRDGMELSVLDRKDKWLQVADAQKRIGWLMQPQVEILHY